MSKVLTIVRREFMSNLLRPSFLFTAFGTPLMIVGIIFMINVLNTETEITLEEYGVIGYVDRSAVGVLSGEIIVPDEDAQYRAFDTLDSAREALDAGEIKAYFELTRPYIVDGRVNLYAYERVPEIVRSAIERLLVANLSADLDTDIPVARITSSVEDMTVRVLGTDREVNREGMFVLVMLPIFFALLLVTASLTTSSFLMYGLVEEKQNRIIEMIVTSVTPLQLLTGKIIGLGLLGLLQVSFLVGAAFIGLNMAQGSDLLQGVVLPSDMIVLAFLYFFLSYAVLSAALAGLGVLVGSEQESRQMSGFIIMPFMIPYFALFAFIGDANGTIPVVMSILPITSPMAMMMRIGLVDVPLIEILASLGLMTLTAVFFVWGSARVFRWGLLLYGKSFDLRAVIRFILRRNGRKDGMETSVAHTLEDVGR